MALLVSGTEQNDWDLAASEQLEVNVAAVNYTLVAATLVQIEVQLGNAANLLHASGGILAITVKVTSVDTGDQLIMPQKQMNLAAGDRMARISLDPFWVKASDIIEVHAKSSNAGDDSVGGKVWVVDITPGEASAGAIVAALMADTSFTAGGTLTYSLLCRLLAGLVGGTWRDKPTDSTKQELLDIDDNATILLEQTLSASTPYKVVTGT